MTLRLKWGNMGILEMFGIAIGLSMDAFAVSITNGIIIKELKFHQGVRIAAFFGLFQAIMPIIGWFSAKIIYSFVSNYAHWIAFVLLLAIGLKMCYEALKKDDDSIEKDKWNCLNWGTLFTLSFATSIDALAVGISFGVLNSVIILPVIIIGLVTFVISLIGVNLGNKIGHLFEKKMEVVGGIILIGIGLKILIEGLI